MFLHHEIARLIISPDNAEYGVKKALNELLDIKLSPNEFIENLERSRRVGMFPYITVCFHCQEKYTLFQDP